LEESNRSECVGEGEKKKLGRRRRWVPLGWGTGWQAQSARPVAQWPSVAHTVRMRPMRVLCGTKLN